MKKIKLVDLIKEVAQNIQEPDNPEYNKGSRDFYWELINDKRIKEIEIEVEDG